MTDVVCYYHDPVKAPLLRDAVFPALAAATRPDGATGHVERHWLHGPHVRLRLSGPADVETAVAILHRYLRTAPSRVDIPDGELLDEARRAAVAELLNPPFEPLHANNTVRIEASDTTRIRELLSSDALVHLRSEGLRLGVPAITAAVSELDGGDHARVQLALTAMTVHAANYPAGLANGYHSYLSHVEDFLLATDDGRIRAWLDGVWLANADTVTETVRRIASGDPASDAERAWGDWTTDTRLAAERAFDAGELTSAPNPRYGERAYEIGDATAIRRYNYHERTEFSAYHTKLWEVDLEHPLIKRPLTVYRFGTNVLYQLLAICDVTPMERYLAAHLVAQAAQRITGIGWPDHLASLAELS